MTSQFLAFDAYAMFQHIANGGEVLTDGVSMRLVQGDGDSDGEGEYNYDDDYDSDRGWNDEFPEGLKQVAFSTDGTTIVTIMHHSEEVVLWNADAGTLKKTLSAEDIFPFSMHYPIEFITGVAISHDASMLAVGDDNGRLAFYDLSNDNEGEVLKSECHPSNPYSKQNEKNKEFQRAMMSAGGEYGDPDIYTFNNGDVDPLNKLEFSHDGSMLVAATAGDFQLIDVATKTLLYCMGGPIARGPGSVGDITALALSADSKILVFAGINGIGYAFLNANANGVSGDMQPCPKSKYSCLAIMKRNQISSVAADDDYLILAGSRLGVVEMWGIGCADADGGEESDRIGLAHEFDWKGNPIQSVHFSQSGRHIFAFSGQSIRLWQLFVKEQLLLKPVFTGPPVVIEGSIPRSVKLFAMNSKYLVGYDNSSSDEEEVYIYNRSAFVPKCVFCMEREGTKKCAKCRGVVYCSRDCQKRDWKKHKKVCQVIKERVQEMQKEIAKAPRGPRMKAKENEYSHTKIIRFHPKERWLLSSTNHPVNPGQILLQPLTSTSNGVRKLVGHEIGISALAFSTNGDRIASGSWDYTLRTWKVSTGEAIFTMKGSDGGVTAVAFSHDDSKIVSGTELGQLSIWKTHKNKRMHTFRESTGGRIYCVAFSPDGKTVASAASGALSLWCATKSVRQLPQVFEGAQEIPGHPQCLSFSPDGSTLACASSSGAINVWTVATGARILNTPVWETEEPVFSLTYSSSGTSITLRRGRHKKIYDVMKQVCDYAGDVNEAVPQLSSFGPSTKVIGSSNDHLVVLHGEDDIISTLRRY
eukprot:g1446.t1